MGMTVAAPRVIFVDLLMATMDSISTWSAAAGSREAGLAWRDAVTYRMIESGRYVAYEGLVARAAEALGLSDDAPRELWRAWLGMEPWPDADALSTVHLPFAFVTNCSTALAEIAVNRSRLRPAFTLSAEEAGWYKPRPEMYRLACQRAGVEPGEARFIAGAAYDAVGASTTGLPTILVARRPPVPAGIAAVASLEEAIADI